MAWSGRLGASGFRVIRGGLGLAQSNPPAEAAECVAQVDPGVQPQQITMSQATLSLGSVLFYLVATENPQGAVSFGIDGDGDARPTLPTTCPAGS